MANERTDVEKHSSVSFIEILDRIMELKQILEESPGLAPVLAALERKIGSGTLGYLRNLDRALEDLHRALAVLKQMERWLAARPEGAERAIPGQSEEIRLQQVARLRTRYLLHIAYVENAIREARQDYSSCDEADLPEWRQKREEKERYKHAGPSPLTSELPPTLFAHALGFLAAPELGTKQATRSTFFDPANEAVDEKVPEEQSRKIGFTPEARAALDASLERFPGVTPTQRAWLQSGHQNTDLMRAVFLSTCAEIFAGRLSVQDAMGQITQLTDPKNPHAFDIPPTSDLLLAKLGKACLQEDDLEGWQREALGEGFTLSDLLSDWMRIQHVDGCYTFTDYEDAPPEWTVENLRGLHSYQAEGLRVGFTLNAVQSDWFSPLHVEAARFVPVEGIHRHFTPEEWVALFNSSPFLESGPDAGKTILYKGMFMGGAVQAFCTVLALLPPVERIALLTHRLESGPDKEKTPLYTVLKAGPAGGKTFLYALIAGIPFMALHDCRLDDEDEAARDIFAKESLFVEAHIADVEARLAEIADEKNDADQPASSTSPALAAASLGFLAQSQVGSDLAAASEYASESTSGSSSVDSDAYSDAAAEWEEGTRNL